MNTIRNTHPHLAKAIHDTAINPKHHTTNQTSLEALVIEAATLINPALAQSLRVDLEYGAVLEVSDSDEFDSDCQVSWEFNSNEGPIVVDCGTFDKFTEDPADVRICIGYDELVDAPLAEQAVAA